MPGVRFKNKQNTKHADQSLKIQETPSDVIKFRKDFPESWIWETVSSIG